MKLHFDYESKPFGVGKVKLSPNYIPALKLKYGLFSLKEVKGKVLEVGCGGGAMAKAIKYYRPDLKVYGCDISHLALSFAKKNSEEVSFLYGDIYKLPFKDDYFDAVLGFDVVEHLNDLLKALLEIKRVLRKDGILHIAIPYEGSLLNIEGLLAKLGWKVKKIYCGHVHQFSVGEVEKLIENQGFKLTKKHFSSHLINQIVDAAYFSLIGLRGKNFPYQIEGYVSVEKGIFRDVLNIVKSIFASVAYYESLLLFWAPGLTGHLTFKK